MPRIRPVLPRGTGHALIALMRKTILALSFALTGTVVAASTSSCGGGGNSGGEGGVEGGATCNPGETQECAGASGCVGGQLCEASGEWSACECLDSGGFTVDGSTHFIDSGSGG